MQYTENAGKGPYGIKFEVQLHLCNLILAKEPDHILYEITRLIKYIKQGTTFNNVLTTTGTTEESFNELLTKLTADIASIDQTDSAAMIAALNTWKTDKDNVVNSQKFVEEINTFARKIYSKAWSQFEINPNADTCNLSEIIDNSTCSYIPGKSMYNHGIAYLKSIWNTKKRRRARKLNK